MNWKKLTIESKEEIDFFLKNRFETSDMNFTNLYLWSFSENIQYAITDDVLYLKGYYEGNIYYFAPVPKSKIKEHLIKAITYIKKENNPIYFIPKSYAEILQLKYDLKEERNSFDYVYLQKNLSELKGRRFSSKKNKINQFTRNYNYSYEQISEKNIEEIRCFQREWIETREVDNIVLSENIGIENILTNYKKLALRGGVLKVDGKVIAYSIGEKLTDNMGVIHIEKGDFTYSGCYQLINMLVSKLEFDDVLYINREDDFGSVGLRKAKISYQPIKFLKKYSL